MGSLTASPTDIDRLGSGSRFPLLLLLAFFGLPRRNRHAVHQIPERLPGPARRARPLRPRGPRRRAIAPARTTRTARATAPTPGRRAAPQAARQRAEGPDGDARGDVAYEQAVVTDRRGPRPATQGESRQAAHRTPQRTLGEPPAAPSRLRPAALRRRPQAGVRPALPSRPPPPVPPAPLPPSRCRATADHPDPAADRAAPLAGDVTYTLPPSDVLAPATPEGAQRGQRRRRRGADRRWTSSTSTPRSPASAAARR